MLVATLRLLLFLAVPLSFTSCREGKVTSYRIPKEQAARPSPTDAATATTSPPPAATIAARPVGDLTWSAPAEWKSKGTSSMRRGSFDVGEGNGPLADLAITVFPGTVGGDLANVNRWLGQIDLPPITEAELEATLQPVPGTQMPTKVAHLTGGKADNPLGMLAAIVPHEGATWFFKLMGPAAIVVAEKSRFIEFLKTVKPGKPTAAAAASDPMAAPPPAEVIAASAAIPELRWTAPAHWQSKPASALRKATFVIPAGGGGGAAAELAVTAFPGMVGGELANVNRWRAQLQLPPLDEAGLAAAITRLSAHDLPVAVVDFAGGPDGSQRMLGAIVPHKDATWFFKLSGPDAAVAAEKPVFLTFLQSLSAP